MDNQPESHRGTTQITHRDEQIETKTRQAGERIRVKVDAVALVVAFNRARVGGFHAAKRRTILEAHIGEGARPIVATVPLRDGAALLLRGLEGTRGLVAAVSAAALGPGGQLAAHTARRVHAHAEARVTGFARVLVAIAAHGLEGIETLVVRVDAQAEVRPLNLRTYNKRCASDLFELCDIQLEVWLVFA